MIHSDDVIALPQFHCKFIWLCRFLFFFFICFSIYVNNFFWNQCNNDYRINLPNALEVRFSSKEIINPFRTPRSNERNGSWYLNLYTTYNGKTTNPFRICLGKHLHRAPAIDYTYHFWGFNGSYPSLFFCYKWYYDS